MRRSRTVARLAPVVRSRAAMLRRSFLYACIGFAWPLSGCNELLDIGDPQLVAPSDDELAEAGVPSAVAQRCVLSSDCSREQTYVCIFGVCSPECAADRDCDDGSRCLATEEEGPACVQILLAECDRDDDCPRGSSCRTGGCRNSCDEDPDCLGGQACNADGHCVGTDPAHESSRPNTEGEDASTQDNASDDGSATDPGTVPSVVDSGLNGDAASDEPSAAGDCTEDGLFCDGPAGVGRHQCSAGERQALDPCPTGQLCDSTSAEARCAQIAPQCVGRQAGEGFCVGRVRTVCSSDLLSVDSVECASAQLCNAGRGGECAVCLDNTFSCDGSDLLACANDHMSFGPEPLQTCNSAAECNAAAGACTTDACLDGQRRCEGDSLLECSDDLASFDQLVEECPEGLCDSVSASCKQCVAGDSWCSDDGSAFNECAADGTRVESTDCPDTAPFCIGNGNCVECADSGQCAPQECYTATCNGASGTCVYLPATAGQSCAAGVCNGAGACVQCTTAADCGASNACLVAACESGSCVEQPRTSGAACDFDGGNVCDGSGDCVQCVNSTHCTTSNACYAPACGSDNTCSELPVQEGAACSFDGGSLCDGSGACVACVDDDDCTAENACFSATCNAGSCEQTASGAGTSCDFAGGAVCDGAGACVECTLPTHCDVDDCWTATCSSDHQCDVSAQSPGVTCNSNGGQVCDGAGECVGCLGHSDCDAPDEYCDVGGVCQENTQFSVGHTQTTGSSPFSPNEGFMWVTRISVTENIDVATMALRGTAAGGSARMFLYADDNGQPGAFIAGTPVFAVQNGESGATPQPAATSLTAGTYWLGATFTGSPGILSYDFSGAQSWRLSHGWTDLAPDPFDEAATPSSLAFTFNFYLWARVDTD